MMADEANIETAPEAEAATAPVKAAPAPAAVEAAPAPVEAPKPVRARRARAEKAAPAPQPKAAAKPARRKSVPKRAARVARVAAPVAVAAAIAAKKIVKRNRIIETEGTRTMKNETNKIADNVQALFGEANERARVQIERNTRFAEELTELGRGNVEAFVASGKIAAKGAETLGQEVAEYGRKSFEKASAALKAFAEVKSPTDFFRLQSEFARTQFDSLVAETSRLSETVIKLAGDVAEPLAGRYTVAAEKVKAAAAF
jgi:phasin family protein